MKAGSKSTLSLSLRLGLTLAQILLLVAIMAGALAVIAVTHRIHDIHREIAMLRHEHERLLTQRRQLLLARSVGMDSPSELQAQAAASLGMRVPEAADLAVLELQP